MKWSNLEDGLCPQCDKRLNEVGDMMKCECGFIIATRRAMQIIRDRQNPLRRKGRDETEENLSALSNL